MEASSTRCVDSRIMQRKSLSWMLGRSCVKLCATVKKQLLCTGMSPYGRHGIDCHSSQGHDPTFQLHVWIAPKELQSCSVHVKDTTELRLFSQSGLVCTTSNCLPLPLPFLLFLPLFVLLSLLLFELLYASPAGLNVLLQFLQVLMSVLLVLLKRVSF